MNFNFNKLKWDGICTMVVCAMFMISAKWDKVPSTLVQDLSINLMFLIGFVFTAIGNCGEDKN